jgi:hypothetical protein
VRAQFPAEDHEGEAAVRIADLRAVVTRRGAADSEATG